MTLADLYEDYEDKLHQYAQRLTQDPDRADDLVQDTFVRAMGHLALLKMLKRHQRRAWLYRTLKNLFIDQLNAQRRQTKLFEQLTRETPTVGYLPESLDVVDPFDLVPEQYRDLFEKRYRLGMNSQEIAEALGIPAPTVRSRLHLGMKKLRSKLRSELRSNLRSQPVRSY